MDQNLAKRIRALSNPSRIKIIQALLERQKTLTELSIDLDLHKSTVKNHLLKLETANLISTVEQTNNYKYYKLTKVGLDVCMSGKNILDILAIISVVFINLVFITNNTFSNHKDIFLNGLAFYIGLIILNSVFLLLLIKKNLKKYY